MKSQCLILLLTLTACSTSPQDVVSLQGDAGHLSVIITTIGGGSMIVADARRIPENIQLNQGPVDSEIAAKYLRVLLMDPQTGLPGPPILGSYRFDRDSLIFIPAAMATPGYGYRTELTLPGEKDESMPIDIPPLSIPADRTAVESVYPTGEELPANLLKFYVYFSRSMRETADIFDHIHIVDQTLSRQVEEPWRRQQMWSDDGKRLTLLIHPGRIKKGVNLRQELGPVLRPDHRYTLVIDADLLDADGQPLAREHRKHFQALAEDGSRPALDRAEITVAKDGVLYVDFKKRMDHALLARMIHVKNAEGAIVQGVGKVFQGERAWMFTPAKPWKHSRYTLIVDENLEDLSGNTPSRVFDADLDNPDHGPIVLQRTFSPN